MTSVWPKMTVSIELRAEAIRSSVDSAVRAMAASSEAVITSGMGLLAL